MKPKLVVENVSKKFSRKSNTHLSYGVRDLFNEIIGRNRNTKLRQDEFIAVNDLSFALYPGDSFALIGRNGCGKTTMLNMLNGKGNVLAAVNGIPSRNLEPAKTKPETTLETDLLVKKTPYSLWIKSRHTILNVT